MSSSATAAAPAAAEARDAHGLTADERAAIRARLGREPNDVEAALYGALWSEHCAYKHSRTTLATLPTAGARVVAGPGENAGALDLGDGLVVVFKMESHNHPSAVEPFEGAATGVGGILRDIFAMGARPIALLDSLRFGAPDTPAMRRLVEGVVEGIAAYGNCTGVPTVGGDAMFDDAHAGNILVNVMAVGVAQREHLVRGGTSAGVGGALLYFGNATGRDGLHGATFASAELSAESAARRGAVQVGDPFMGKKIMEASLELARRGLVLAMQDMGAAGLACAAGELAVRGALGVSLDLDAVPQRAASMAAAEILLSESQERMLAVVAPQDLEAALAVCSRWECGGAVVGEVRAGGQFLARHRGAIVAYLPVAHLIDEAPRLNPPVTSRRSIDSREHGAPAMSAEELRRAALMLLGRPGVASKRWIWERYDHMVQCGTVVRPGEAGAAVLRVCGEGGAMDKLLAVASGGNHRHVARDARVGAELAVCDVARAVVCVGAEPIGLTNCLNFGSPERPEIFATFRDAIAGIADACRALRIPVTGGNVSFYNERGGVAIPPTPMIGMVGTIDDVEHITRAGARRAGDLVCLLGPESEGLDGSEFDLAILGARTSRGDVPFDLPADVALQRVVLAAIRDGIVSSAQCVSRGGLFVALAKVLLRGAPALGLQIGSVPCGVTPLGLFGELPPRVLLSIDPDDLPDLAVLAGTNGVECTPIGTVTERPGLAIEGLGSFSRLEIASAYERPPYDEQ